MMDSVNIKQHKLQPKTFQYKTKQNRGCGRGLVKTKLRMKKQREKNPAKGEIKINCTFSIP